MPMRSLVTEVAQRSCRFTAIALMIISLLHCLNSIQDLEIPTTVKNVNWDSVLDVIHSPNHEICSNSSYFIAVRCSARNFIFRSKWRQSFGILSKKHNYSYAFFIGRSNESTTQSLIDHESNKFSDIHQIDSIDSYRNITFKTVASMKFFADNCRNTTVLVKLDDDVDWDSESISTAVEKFKPSGYDFACLVLRKKGPIRRFSNKWFVSYTEYSYPLYPDYCAGPMYFVRKSAVTELLKWLRKSDFLWIDDVYLTGILRAKANQSLLDFEELIESENSIFSWFAKKKQLFIHNSF